ncbi:MAG: hypothetical protein U5K38_10315 [Woeseiaceae bacterium]|nr:hypothetical protein [Woeseiaceae bacterium]
MSARLTRPTPTGTASWRHRAGRRRFRWYDGQVRPEIVWAATGLPDGLRLRRRWRHAGHPARAAKRLDFQAPGDRRGMRRGCTASARQERLQNIPTTTLTGPGGEVLAICKTTWIEVSDAVLKGEGPQRA